jgi:hypothetical protein
LKEPKEKPVFIECDCHSEMLQVEWDDEYDLVYMSYYSYGHNRKFPWLYRLKYIWEILTKGHPYSDCIVLSHNERHKLLDILQDRSNKIGFDIDTNTGTSQDEGPDKLDSNNKT